MLVEAIDQIGRQRECRKLNNSIEAVIGPPSGYERRVDVVVRQDYVFQCCIDEQHKDCPGTAGMVGCSCPHHKKDREAAEDEVMQSQEG